MHKIKLAPIYDYTIPKGAKNYQDLIRDHMMYQLLTDNQIEWLFKNIQGKFYTDSCFIFFSEDSDAVAFKLRWL